jgi:hypothetical protein
LLISLYPENLFSERKKPGMNRIARAVLAFVCLAGFLLSAGITAYLNLKADRNAFGEWLAPVYFNMEIDRDFADRVAVYSPAGAYSLYNLHTRQTGRAPEFQRIELSTELKQTTFHRKIYLRVPLDVSAELINAIDNISVFIGNKLCYYPAEAIRRFAVHEEDGYALFHIPDLFYTRSLFVRDWANYYGDLNLVLLLMLNFVLKPFRFAVSWLFLIGFLFLCRKHIQAAWARMEARVGSPAVFAFALGLVVALGFTLRINGYVRFSGWSDEIYSAVRAGNPAFSPEAVFSDAGNPPFYFLLLRYWFNCFGWSEESGTMLSVVLGTLAIPALYLFVRQHCGAKTALLASFFMALSGFAVGYSHEMRAYILKIFLSPLAALTFLGFLKKQSLLNFFLYIAVSVPLVNAHYYGVLLITANFLFYCFYEIKNKSFTLKRGALFFAATAIIALSFMPFFLYQLLVNRYDFEREFVPGMEHIGTMAVIAALGAFALVYRLKMAPFFSGIFTRKQALFVEYVVSIPALVFTLSFFISFVKPMISFRYLLPVSFPFFLSAGAVLISAFGKSPTMKYLAVFLVWAASLSLYEGKPGIPGGGYASYRQARAFIAADTAAHPNAKASMLDPADENARYYGFTEIPGYDPTAGQDVLYVFNDIFHMNEQEQYENLHARGLNDENMLIIIPNNEVVIFKKYLK